MSVLPIHLYGSPALKKKAVQIKELDDNKATTILNMFETMKGANGIGLAANQCGLTDAMIVIDLSDIKEDADEELGLTKELKKPLILINPKIMDSWDEITFEEGCLSVPDLRAEISRPEFIKISYRNGNFNEQVLEVGGFLARVIQHEYDHLNGILFPERLGKIRLARLRNRINKIKSGDVEPDYPFTLK
jgi:peptide deformylase